ncbi:hypothetical protein LIER_44066 [Lithospermum erythrorhizon]|uniref:Integrase catalytic domain-containing protein n=1 Tax=Lithospermum erythrorhizon TaxID=34254 RepID=A0AAV3NYR9_LITER
MVTGLQKAQALKIRRLFVRGDLQLVIKQIRGNCGVKSEELRKYHAKELALTKGFEYILLKHIPRGGVLLAHHHERCDRVCKEVPCMSKNATDSPKPCNRDVPRDMSNPFGHVGHKPRRSVSQTSSQVQYFSKWVEAAPLRTTTAEAIEEFIWRNIITRYGIPRILISDNGPQFDSRVIKEM